jgi:DNA (cytosine-5)-methyltransferase 1
MMKRKKRPLLLDLFSGAGGAAMGYYRAGFDVVGVDHRPQPRYPFRFIQADALEYVSEHGHGYDAIHASPPCQAYSSCQKLKNVRTDHPNLLPLVRQLLERIGLPWIIENVIGAPMARSSVMLCGLQFGLKLFRHRLFESSILLLSPGHIPHGKRRIGIGGYSCPFGNGGRSYNSTRKSRTPPDHCNKAAWQRSLGIDWMIRNELSQAIPPAYTEFIGRQLIAAL